MFNSKKKDNVGVEIRMPYEPVPRSGTDFSDTVSLTQQQFAPLTDVYTILHMHGAFKPNGHLNHEIVSGIPTGGKQVTYADFANMPQDYEEFSEFMDRNYEFWMSQSSAIRERFQNDQAVFFDWLIDPQNEKEALDLGILTSPVQPAPEAEAAPASGSQDPASAGVSSSSQSTETEKG